MSVVWKSFKLSSIFDYSGKHVIKTPIKELKTYKTYQDGLIANVTSTKNNNGINCYVELNNEIENKKVKNVLTIATNGSVGVCFYHPYYIISTGDSKVIEIYNSKLKKIFDNNEFLYYFFSKLLTRNFYKTYYSYTKKIKKEDVDSTTILLPCISLSSSDDYIWEDNNNYYTLAVDYIKKLMDSAKKLKEEKTIKLYEKERAKYEAERVKYEAAYVLERSLLVWKEFKLGDIFVQSTEHYLNKSKKNYKINKEKTTEFCVAVCAASKYNNGIVGYINEIDDVPEKKRKGFLTKSGFGNVFYQDDWFIKPGGSWGMLNIVKFKDEKIKRFFDNNKILYKFISKTLTKILVQITTWQFTPNFDNEILLLPLIEVSKTDDYIWEDNSHYYTLATNYISYLYLTGRINKYQKLIDEYTYK